MLYISMKCIVVLLLINTHKNKKWRKNLSGFIGNDTSEMDRKWLWIHVALYWIYRDKISQRWYNDYKNLYIQPTHAHAYSSLKYIHILYIQSIIYNIRISALTPDCRARSWLLFICHAYQTSSQFKDKSHRSARAPTMYKSSGRKICRLQRLVEGWEKQIEL